MATDPTPQLEDRQGYLDPITMFRFPFTKSSIQWGVVVGTLLAFHKFNHTSKRYLEKIMDSSTFGMFYGFLTGAGVWVYSFYQYGKVQNLLRQQAINRADTESTKKFFEYYFRNKMNLEE